ncbi:hypothetical protein HanXRQr2_Chr10g0431661 [Helianthus annuus]|uniref:Uncharacterized protein n=1 Tax=Helianthus annuus TaxID=4232 RepID=A0A251TIJ3_HELAN|nr:hypothetical protein HanXRQr2_Chr10g0431661 [Helianthus annuus]
MGFRTGRVSDRNGFWADTSFRTRWVSDRNGFWAETSFRKGRVSGWDGFVSVRFIQFRFGSVSSDEERITKVATNHLIRLWSFEILNRRLGFSTLIYHRAISIDQDNRFNQAGYRGGAIRLCHTANSTPYHGSAKLLAETFYLFIQLKSQTQLPSRIAYRHYGFWYVHCVIIEQNPLNCCSCNDGEENGHAIRYKQHALCFS